MTDTLSESSQPPLGVPALDTYSQIVTSVAAELNPRVAALQVSRRRRNGNFEAGAGSAVVFTNDGFLLTNAHVVGRAEAGKAAFHHMERSSRSMWWVPIRCRTWLWCAPRARPHRRLDSARPLPSVWANWLSPSATRSVWRAL